MAPQEWLDYAEIDPEYEAFVKANPRQFRVADFPDMPTFRNTISSMMIDAINKMASAETPGVKVSEIQIPVRDGAKIRALLYQPDDESKKGGPLCVLYHGGGFCIGSAEMEFVAAKHFVSKYGGVAVSVEYRKAPENKFPVPINDGWDACKWVAANASSLDADPTKGFLVGGSSAGGNLSSIVGMLAKDEKLSPPLTGLWLCIPGICHPSVIPAKYKDDMVSHSQNADNPGLNESDYQLFMEAYGAPYEDPLFSPLFWESGHKGHPKTYFQVCGMDPLRDEGLIYEKVLREAGVETKLDIYPGVPHGHWLSAPHLQKSKQYFEDNPKGFDWLMGGE